MYDYPFLNNYVSDHAKATFHNFIIKNYDHIKLASVNVLSLPDDKQENDYASRYLAMYALLGILKFVL
jgi:hypothetical protein